MLYPSSRLADGELFVAATRRWVLELSPAQALLVQVKLDRQWLSNPMRSARISRVVTTHDFDFDLGKWRVEHTIAVRFYTKAGEPFGRDGTATYHVEADSLPDWVQPEVIDFINLHAATDSRVTFEEVAA